MNTYTFKIAVAFTAVEVALGLAPACGYELRTVRAKGTNLADAMARYERAANGEGA